MGINQREEEEKLERERKNQLQLLHGRKLGVMAFGTMYVVYTPVCEYVCDLRRTYGTQCAIKA